MRIENETIGIANCGFRNPNLMGSQKAKRIVIASGAKQSHHFQPIEFIFRLLDCLVVPLLAMTGRESP